jgi:serine/threonine protein kinase
MFAASKMSANSQPKVKRYFGSGTYGIIIGCPRLPAEGETHAELLVSSAHMCNQVSKVIKDRDDIEKLTQIIELINNKFSPANLAQLQTHIAIPTPPKPINWSDLSKYPDEVEFLKSHKITKRRTKWQYIMERGNSDLDIELRSVSTLNQFKHFLKGFGNIIQGVAKLHAVGLVHTDIKLTNMIVSWDGRYKLIDLDELGDTNIIPNNKYHYEKLFNNTYYPYYSPACVFLKVLPVAPISTWEKNICTVLFQTLIRKNYDKDYHKYFNNISQDVLKIVADSELTRIIQGPYNNNQAMIDYLVAFKDQLMLQPNNHTQHRELLLFIDRYALGINLLILLGKYYRLTGQIPSTTQSKQPSQQPSSHASNNSENICEFIPQNLIAIIKLCCNPKNYSAITTQQIADEFQLFINTLFRRYPFKFIIKLLSGFSHPPASQPNILTKPAMSLSQNLP